jgi:hypothetical protein
MGFFTIFDFASRKGSPRFCTGFTPSESVRSPALGPETGRTWREEQQEASHRGDREKAGGVVASPVGERRSVRTVAQQQPNDRSRSRVKTKSFQEEKRQEPKAEFR